MGFNQSLRSIKFCIRTLVFGALWTGSCMCLLTIGNSWRFKESKEKYAHKMPETLNTTDGRFIVVGGGKNTQNGRFESFIDIMDSQGHSLSRIWPNEICLSKEADFVFVRRAQFLDDNTIIISGCDELDEVNAVSAEIWVRRYPEYWWGFVALPESYFFLFLSTILFWSIYQDINFSRMGLSQKKLSSKSRQG